MKKLFVIVLLIITLAGCSVALEPLFSPPEWILGTWSDEYEINTYTFNDNNVLMSTTSLSVDFAEFYKDDYREELITASQYKVTTEKSGIWFTVRFDKLTDTTLNYYVGTGGVTTGPVVLIKK